jgi:flagellar biogenesis protein FliO|tara:strand:- start:13 stop:195 length:183 start_codon:yes stop_codon:yes gene_type:complete
MQLKYNRQPSIGSSIGRILIKLILALVFMIVVIFLIEKINFPSPEQKYKIDITDEINKLK